MDTQEAFGAAIRRLRQTLSLSQEGLADAAGLDRTYVSSLERGRRNPSLATIVRVAKALGVEPQVLMAVMQEEQQQQAARSRS